MASHIGSYAATQFLAAALRGDTITWPANMYLAFFTTVPTAADGTGAVEPSTNNYSRAAIAAGHTNWGAPALDVDNLTTKITLAVAGLSPTPSGSWGTLKGVGLYDASTSGHLWFYFTTSDFTVGSGIPITLPTTFYVGVGG